MNRSMRAGELLPATPWPFIGLRSTSAAFNEGRGVTPGDASPQAEHIFDDGYVQ